MDFEKVHNGEETVYYIKGRLDTQSSPVLQRALDAGLEEGEKCIVLDLKETEYLSSSGLRVILYTKKRIDDIPTGDFVIKSVPEVIMEIFEMTGFNDFITIEKA